MAIAALLYATAPIVSVVLTMSTIFMALGAFVIHGETLKWLQWVSMTLGVAVVTLLIYATATDGVIEHMFQDALNLPLGVGLAVAGAFLLAMSMVTLRSVKGQVHFFAFLVVYATITILFSVPLAFVFSNDFMQIVNQSSIPLMAVLAWQGIAHFLSQYLMNKIALLAKLGPIQTFIVATSLVLLCVVDLFMGYQYQMLAWIFFLLTLVWLPLSYVVDAYCNDDGPSSKDSTKA